MGKKINTIIKPENPNKISITPDKMSELINVLLNNNFNISKSCEIVGIPRAHYYYLLKYDKDFKNAIDFTGNILSNVATNGLLEGLTNADLMVRAKYLDILSRGSMLQKLLNVSAETENSDIDEVTLD